MIIPILILYQKNIRIILDDGTYQKPVIIYLMLVDSNSNFINSNSTGTWIVQLK